MYSGKHCPQSSFTACFPVSRWVDDKGPPWVDSRVVMMNSNFWQQAEEQARHARNRRPFKQISAFSFFPYLSIDLSIYLPISDQFETLTEPCLVLQIVVANMWWHHTPLSTLNTLHFTIYTLHSTLHTLQATLYNFPLHTFHFTLHTLHSTLYTVHSTLYTLTLRTLHSTLYLHSTL